MQLVDDVKRDVAAAKKIRLPWWGVLCWMIGCAPIIWRFYQSGRPDLALPTLNFIAVIGFTVAFKWELRRYAWFWMTMAVVAAFNLSLVLYVPWTVRWVPAIAIAAIDSAEFCGILAILSLVGRIVGPANGDG